MRVLVVGGGGREHALCQAIAASPLLTNLWCAPGNPGIARIATCVPIGVKDVSGLADFARSTAIDLVVAGGVAVGGVAVGEGGAGVSIGAVYATRAPRRKGP